MKLTKSKLKQIIQEELKAVLNEADDECKPGETFDKGDGCNTCKCPKSGKKSEAACTEMACADPDDFGKYDESVLKEQKMTVDNSIAKLNMYDKAHGGKGEITAQFIADKLDSGELDPKKYFNFIRNKVEPWLQKQKKTAAPETTKRQRYTQSDKGSTTRRDLDDKEQAALMKFEMKVKSDIRSKLRGANRSAYEMNFDINVNEAIARGWLPSTGWEGITDPAALTAVAIWFKRLSKTLYNK